MTLEEAVTRLREAGVDNPRLDARLLWEFAEQNAQTAPPPHPDPLPQSWGRGNVIEFFATLIARRIAREPLAYITGRKEFWSLDFAVGPGVLIPRPDTETVIETALRHYPDKTAPLSILDLGTGSGCLLIAALHEFPNAHGVGIDSSPEALVWARRNVAAHKLEDRATLIETGWLEEASPGFDIVLANPPYIPSGDLAALQPEVARYEPRAALDGGPDGLDAYRALAPRIARLLSSAGHAFLEIGQGQGDAVATLLAAAGLQVPAVNPDLAGIPRMAVAKRDSPWR
ncbi:MAG TPA: peptide chain release factor N(5)-glutamine methyltransferase [Rhizomicrobium sp.]